MNRTYLCAPQIREHRRNCIFSIKYHFRRRTGMIRDGLLTKRKSKMPLANGSREHDGHIWSATSCMNAHDLSIPGRRSWAVVLLVPGWAGWASGGGGGAPATACGARRSTPCYYSSEFSSPTQHHGQLCKRRDLFSWLVAFWTQQEPPELSGVRCYGELD